MSIPINDGGPAFPSPMFTRQADGMPMSPQEYGLGGMTLRDWFAGKALAATPAEYMVEQPDHVIADFAYSLADAMLKAREAKP
jgi:hypothetical protein